MITVSRMEQEREAAITSLQQRIRACRLCQDGGYIPIAHPIVNGRASDRMLVIGQAPGHRSVAKGRSFSGPGGTIYRSGWSKQAFHLAIYMSMPISVHSRAATRDAIQKGMEIDDLPYRKSLCAGHF